MPSRIWISLPACVLATLLQTFGGPLAAQERPDISTALQALQSGDRARAEELAAPILKRFRNDAAAWYLQAALTSRAADAIQLYQRIWNEDPDGAWADDAGYRLYQYSMAVGAYQTAEKYRQKLLARWPRSVYTARLTVDRAGATPREVQATADPVAGLTESAPQPASADNTRSTKQRPQGASSDPRSEAFQTKESPASVREDGRGYAVQAGLYAARNDARRRETELEALGYSVSVLERRTDGAAVFAVLVGRFDAAEQAKSFRKKLKAQTGIDGKVVER